MYDVTASRDGFRPARFEGAEILLGQVKQLDFTLAVGAVQEKASVSADPPLVDVKRSARAVSLRQDQLTYLPRGLDYTSVVPLASGANNEQKLGGPACPGTRIVGPLGTTVVPDEDIDPDLDPMKLQEAVVGIERQLRPHLLVTARYVHKQLDRAVEDIGSLDGSFGSGPITMPSRPR